MISQHFFENYRGEICDRLKRTDNLSVLDELLSSYTKPGRVFYADKYRDGHRNLIHTIHYVKVDYIFDDDNCKIVIRGDREFTISFSDAMLPDFGVRVYIDDAVNKLLVAAGDL